MTKNTGRPSDFTQDETDTICEPGESMRPDVMVSELTHEQALEQATTLLSDEPDEAPKVNGKGRPKTRKLTPKQQCFVDEYLVDLNATQAAIRAGYSAKTAEQQGPRLLGNVGVAVAIQAAMEARSERTGITQDYVLNTIRETVERCSQAEPVLDRKGEHVHVETPDGDTVPAYTFDSNAVLRGCELLGRHLKMFTDKVETKVTTGTHEEALDALAGPDSAIDVE